MPTQDINPMGMQVPPPEIDPAALEMKKFVSEGNLAILSANLADSISDKELDEIACECIEGYEADLTSRQDWERSVEEAMKLSLLIKEDKSFPWANASNVKYPMVATACMQFAARAYPSLVPGNKKIVKARVVGPDPSGKKLQRAQRIERHMSYQIMDEMKEWEEEMDRALNTAPLLGQAYKKVFFDAKLGRNRSVFVHPKNLIVNYWTKSLESCPRTSEYYELSKREVISRQRRGFFIDMDLPDPTVAPFAHDKDTFDQIRRPQDDRTLPYRFIEQHTFLDLDDDGYSEPYIVWIELNSRKVFRISPRFYLDKVKKDEKGRILEIDPIIHYIKIPFIPSPDGSFYDIGFGQLLGALNQSANTLINQLVDAGTLSNLQSGFIGKGLRLRNGDNKFTPGEWKQVNAVGTDIKDNIFPMPVREPSAVLLQLLQLLITSGKELASIAEIFVGKMPGQNTPAYTTKETVEQGMKLFTAVYKRIFRALGQEFQKLYDLNSIYLNYNQEVPGMEEMVSPLDYDTSVVAIIPAADPSASSTTDRQAKFGSVMQLANMGWLDPQKLTVKGLEVLEWENPADVMRDQPPGPPPEAQKMQAEQQMKQMEMQHKMQLEQAKVQMKQASDQEKAKYEAQMQEMKLKFMAIEMMMKQQGASVDLQTKQAMASQNVQANAMKNQQQLQHAEASHRQKVQQQGAKANEKSADKGKNSKSR